MDTWPDAPGTVALPSGRRVRGRALRRADVPGLLPQYGVYLLAQPPSCIGWAHSWIRCRDFASPPDTQLAVSTLRVVWERAVDERVEVACGGGVGRTGIALALLAIFDGVEVDSAVDWVRTHYHPRAVETPWQRRWIHRVGTELAG